MSLPAPIDCLSPRLRQISDLIGLDLCLAIASAFGGGYITFPVSDRFPKDHPLLSIVPLEAAHGLLSEYRGERLQIPTAHSYRAALRRHEIAEALDEGRAPSEVARSFGVSLRSVQLTRQLAYSEAS
jgi:hypothetical protein